MVNLGCLLDWFWKCIVHMCEGWSWLGLCKWEKCGQQLLSDCPDKANSKGKSLLFCVLSYTCHWQVHLPCLRIYLFCCYCCCIPSLIAEGTFFRLLTWTEHQWLSKNPRGLPHQIGTSKASILEEWAATRLSSPMWASHCYIPTLYCVN